MKTLLSLLILLGSTALWAAPLNDVEFAEMIERSLDKIHVIYAELADYDEDGRARLESIAVVKGTTNYKKCVRSNIFRGRKYRRRLCDGIMDDFLALTSVTIPNYKDLKERIETVLANVTDLEKSAEQATFVDNNMDFHYAIPAILEMGDLSFTSERTSRCSKIKKQRKQIKCLVTDEAASLESKLKNQGFRKRINESVESEAKIYEDAILQLEQWSRERPPVVE